MKKSTLPNLRRFIISRGNWFLTEKITYGSLSCAVTFSAESEALEFLNKNSLDIKDHHIEDMIMLMTSVKSDA